MNKLSIAGTGLTRWTVIFGLLVSASVISPYCAGSEDIGSTALNVSVSTKPKPSCDVDVPGLSFDFTGLTPEEGRSQAVPFSVGCTEQTRVTVSTTWGGSLLEGAVKAFENGDTVRVEVCYAAGTTCFSYPDTWFRVDPARRVLQLKLTYTAAAGELPVTRTGILRLDIP